MSDGYLIDVYGPSSSARPCMQSWVPLGEERVRYLFAPEVGLLTRLQGPQALKTVLSPCWLLPSPKLHARQTSQC